MIPKSLDPKDGYFPPPWNPDEHPEKTIGWLEFQKALKDDPEYYCLRCGSFKLEINE